jgi:hypothetical protein
VKSPHSLAAITIIASVGLNQHGRLSLALCPAGMELFPFNRIDSIALRSQRAAVMMEQILSLSVPIVDQKVDSLVDLVLKHLPTGCMAWSQCRLVISSPWTAP